MKLGKYKDIKIPARSQSINCESIRRNSKSEDLCGNSEQDSILIKASRSLTTPDSWPDQEAEAPAYIKPGATHYDNSQTAEIILNESNQIPSDHLESFQGQSNCIRVPSSSYSSASLNLRYLNDLHINPPSSNKSYLEWEIQLVNSYGINKTTICQICNEALQAKDLCSLGCIHLFCRPCILIYIKLKIEEAQVISMMCPNHECDVEINEELIKDLVPSGLYEKYLKFKASEELSKDIFLRFCPAPDCEGFDRGSSKKQRLTCSQCKFEYCYYCTEKWHDGKKCRMNDDKALDKWANANGVKFCPNCKRKVQKSLGCNHMTCTKCGYEWCWLCGKHFDSSHLESCEAARLKKLNPSLARICLLIACPVLLPFLSIICVCICCYRIKNNDGEFRKLSRFIRNHLWVSYLLAFVLGAALSPFFFVIAPLAISYALINQWLRGSFSRRARYVVIVLLTVLFWPFFILFCLFIALVAHVFGLICLFWKLCIVFIRCKNPRFLMIENNYGIN